MGCGGSGVGAVEPCCIPVADPHGIAKPGTATDTDRSQGASWASRDSIKSRLGEASQARADWAGRSLARSRVSAEANDTRNTPNARDFQCKTNVIRIRYCKNNEYRQSLPVTTKIHTVNAKKKSDQ